MIGMEEISTVGLNGSYIISTENYLAVDGDVEQQDTENIPFTIYSWEIAVIVFLLVFGTMENSVVVYIFTRNKISYSGNAYVIALAVLDIVACLFLAPFFPMSSSITASQNTLLADIVSSLRFAVMMSYLCILTAMSLERVVAVVKPVTYRKTKHWHKYIVTGIIAVSSLVPISFRLAVRYVTQNATTMIIRLYIMSIIGASLPSIIVSYTVIIVKLNRQQSKLGTANTVQSVTQTEKQNAVRQKTRARHVTTAKVFIAVVILFVLSYLPIVITLLTAMHARPARYVYMINHIGNPLIYHTFNKSFRRDTNKFVRALVVKLRDQHLTRCRC